MQTRKPIPLTRIYKRTPCGRALYGAGCPPAACDGRCAASGVLLCCFGLADSPWTRAVDAVRDASDDGALLGATAIAVTFGVDQAQILPLALRRLLLGAPPTPRGALGRLVAIVGQTPRGCVVTESSSAVVEHELLAGVVRPAGCGGHWTMFTRAAGNAWMVVDLATDDPAARDTVITTDVGRLLAATDGLFFHYAQSQYKP